ncbi:hypothetical protein B566_EDAN004839 [Ephemera danica]|nr:hypothetical protein B566_EDAN004839 [Ephemera danica]
MESENIFLFVPNLIGYARVILALISFYFMPTNHEIAIWCYVTSALLDAFDGHAARYFNQSTKFGAILDMLTDRCGTMCLLVTLCLFYPRYTFLFQLSMTIDIACHWIHLHASLMQGKTSHKFIDMSENPVMRIYYTSRTVLFCMFAGIGLVKLLAFAMAPVAIVKSLIALLQGYMACCNLGALDVKEREEARQQKAQ